MKPPFHIVPRVVRLAATAATVGSLSAGWAAPSEEQAAMAQFRDFARTTSLRAAVAAGNVERVTELLDAHPEWLRSRDFEENTLLHRAAAAGHVTVVELLLDRGADPGAVNASFQLPLEIAEINGHGDLARRLRGILAARHQQELDRRISVLILPFRNVSGDPDQAHWSDSWRPRLFSALGTVARLRLLGDSAVRFGLRAMNLKPGEALTLAQAREIGQRVEARRVVWGEHSSTSGGWVVTARMVQVASGEESSPATVSGTNLFDLKDSLVKRLLDALELQPTEEEWRQLQKRGTEEPAAVAAISRALKLQADRRPMKEIESACREALAADPHWSDVKRAVASVLANQGRWAEAQRLTEEVLEVDPEDGKAFVLLGFIHNRMGRAAEAEAAWRTALRLDPEAPSTLLNWGAVHETYRRWETAIHYFSAAVRLDPTAAAPRAKLANVLVHVGDRDGARAELARTEQLDPEDIDTALFTAEGYGRLGEVSKAVIHYERFIALASRQGLQPELVQKMAGIADELRRRLTPTPVRAVPPRAYTGEELEAELASRLTPEERSFASNPLEVTPAMKAWAEEVVRDAPDERARAEALFQAVCQRASGQQGWGARPAPEVFASTHQAPEALSCNEAGKLWAALARAVGLRAFLVHVECDPDNVVRYHDCAIVFLSGEAFLVDPAYAWFGVPHREFAVLDDLEAIAHQMLGSVRNDLPDACQRLRAGVKLHPDLPWAQLNLARGLVLEERYAEAEVAVRRAEDLQPGRWDVAIVRGLLEAHRKRWDAAEEHLRQGLLQNPDDGSGQYFMGEVLLERGALAEAREAYRASLRCLLPPATQRAARLRLAELNERLSRGDTGAPGPQAGVPGAGGAFEELPKP